MSEISDSDGNFYDEAGAPPEPGEEAPKGRRERETKTKTKTKEIVESNEALFLRLLSESRDSDQKLDAKTSQKLLKLYQEAQMGEQRRALDFMTSQRSYMFFLEKHNQSLAAQQTATQNAVLENINKIGELTKSLSEASGGSKFKEAAEVGMMILQLPIFTMLQEELVDWLQERMERKRIAREKAAAKAEGRPYVATPLATPAQEEDGPEQP